MSLDSTCCVNNSEVEFIRLVCGDNKTVVVGKMLAVVSSKLIESIISYGILSSDEKQIIVFD